MAIERNGGVLRHIGAVFRDGIAAEMTDSQLLERSRPGAANRPNGASRCWSSGTGRWS